MSLKIIAAPLCRVCVLLAAAAAAAAAVLPGHHQHSDTAADRHSPRDGLWHAHMGWLFDESLTNTR
jgi:fatty-acid desaturase